MGSETNLELWVKNISTNGLPSLTATANAIAKIDSDSDTPIEQLADYIMQDPGLTAHILRHTQGAYRVPLKGKHNTINRAIVMLGFNEIKSLCLGISILEDLTKGNPRIEFMSQLGITFHAAIQARSLGFEKGERNCEEIFTAALLSRLGNLAFWSLAGDDATKLSKALENSNGQSTDGIEKECLGFSLYDLSQGLGSAWNLQHYTDSRENAFKTYTELGYEIAESAISGWDSQAFESTLGRVSEFLSQPKSRIMESVRKNSMTAMRYALGFGIPGISETLHKICVDEDESAATQNETQEVESSEKKHKGLHEMSDELFQLKTIRGIGTLLEAGTNINELVKIALEGMHRGLAFDRAAFCLISQDRKSLMPKATVNSYSEQLMNVLKISIDPSSVFGNSILNNQMVWAPEGLDPAESLILPKNISQFIGDTEFILAPIQVKNKPIGLFYVDRGIRDVSISHAEFESLKHLVFQSSFTQMRLIL